MSGPTRETAQKPPGSIPQRAEFVERTVSLVLLAVVLAVMFWGVLTLHTDAADWDTAYYPAARALLKLHSPHQDAPLFVAPAWTLIGLLPFAFLPLTLARAVFFMASLGGFAFVGYKMGCKPIGLAAFLLSAPVAHCLIVGNVEWLPLLGLFMPLPLGLIFLSMKPQTTIGAILYLLAQKSRSGFKATALAIAPTALLFGLSIWAYGFWFTLIGKTAVPGAFNLAIKIWPYGVPVGLVLLVLAIRRQRKDLALAASPWLSPYTILLSWSGFIVSFAKSSKAMVVVSALSWMFWLTYRYILVPLAYPYLR